MEENELDLSALGEGHVRGCCEYPSGPSRFQKMPGTISLSKGLYSRELVFKILSRFVLLREGICIFVFQRK